jgi:hypothetical protein
MIPTLLACSMAFRLKIEYFNEIEQFLTIQIIPAFVSGMGLGGTRS